MSWNPHQHRLLTALGYTVHRQISPAVTAVAMASAAVPPASAALTVSADAGTALLQALRKAANGRDIDALALPPIEQLRSDPAAKRALWPQLRALRKHH